MKTGPEVNVPDATTRDTRTRVCPTGMQAMMGYWERLHPVNAVQIAELPHPVSPDDLQSAISRLFCKFLGADADSRWPMLKDDSNLNLTISEIRAEFRVLPETSDHRLESLVTELLNCPFSKDQPPFRVGIADAKHTRYVWLSYRHAIADARSISLLMQNLLEELAWAGAGELPLLVERDERSLSSFFPQKPRYMAELRAVWRTLKTLWKIGRCHRPRPADANSFGMSFQIHAEHLPLSNLQHSARTWNASVGELMLAAMLEWFLEKDRLHRPPARSRNHCMSVLVDLTRRAESKPMRQFGQYLSAVNIIANRRHNSSFEGLLQQVRASVRPENTVADSLHTLHGLSFNSCLVSRMPQAMSNQFQEFVFPISGAFSNVDLNAVLPTPRSDISISNYFRGTCATQMSPMILCLTTFRDTCTLTTTHRNSVYAPNEMREMARSIIGRAFGIDAATITLEQLGPSKGK